MAVVGGGGGGGGGALHAHPSACNFRSTVCSLLQEEAYPSACNLRSTVCSLLLEEAMGGCVGGLTEAVAQRW
jgi:hypothetical protein